MPVFCPIASGSNGNCVYAGSGDTHILFDAGMSGKRVQSSLRLINVDPEKINAIFITHEHRDHISGAGILSRRYNIPLYATKKTWAAMDRETVLGPVARHNKKTVYYDNAYTVGEIVVKPFEISHDAAEPAGYSFFSGDYKVSIATDMGRATDNVKKQLYDSDVLLLESNHDLDMLKNGSYPWPLKKRILSDTGHLSNVGCGVLITEIMSKRLKYVYLGHLSDENNRPYIAMDTVTGILEANNIFPGKDLQLFLADRGQISEYLELADG